MDKTMWIPILLITSLPESCFMDTPSSTSPADAEQQQQFALSEVCIQTNKPTDQCATSAVWAETYVTGVVGRAITIDCHYAAAYRSNTKYWCQWWSEPVSVPVLGFLSPANVSCLGGSVPVSCESGRGSLPISYSWYENIPAVDSKISENNTLDLHCQSFKHQHHQYYCKSSNQRGTKSSEMVNVSISSSGVSCSFLVKINGPGLEYSCETLKRSNYSSSYIAWTVGRWLLFLLLLIWSISIAFFTRASKRRDKSEPGHSAHELQ
ncbi:uncharacterized protein LOC144605520 [Rhinoraja longicauda]